MGDLSIFDRAIINAVTIGSKLAPNIIKATVIVLKYGCTSEPPMDIPFVAKQVNKSAKPTPNKGDA